MVSVAWDANVDCSAFMGLVDATTCLLSVGHYCVEGSIVVCPAGKFGAKEGLASAECSGNCKMGACVR